MLPGSEAWAQAGWELEKSLENILKDLNDIVAGLVADDTVASVIEALDTVYHSQFYDKLMDTETGLYYQSPAYCYEFLKHELKYGKAV